MKNGLTATNPTLEAAFRAALLRQGVLALFIFVLLAIAWVASRELMPARARARQTLLRAALPAEPAGRRLLRIGFGVIWIFDGILQAQPAMPSGLPSQVIAPAAAGSPGWVLHLVNWAGTAWSFHPIQDASAAVWIQLGIGFWLIAAARGRWSRLAGLASMSWGLLVWVFGEAFGSMLAPGQSFLTGAPGGALIYCAAGALLVLPESYWRNGKLGTRALQVTGLFLVSMAVLQAWPGRGFWHGRLGGHPGSLTSMINSMAATRQPSFLAHLLSDFGSFVAGHGFAVNLSVVIVLAVTGAGLLTGRTVIVRPAVIVLIAVCLTDWVLVQDLGFLGGLGTDPNSMLPLALLVAASYLGMTRSPTTATGPALAALPAEPAGPAARSRAAVLRPGPLAKAATVALGTASSSAVVAIWAMIIVVIGAAPMAVAQADRTADPIIARALNGSATSLHSRAPAFALTSQYGKPVTLASLRGKAVLLTFLDPVCTSDCPLLAQEFRAADQVLGSQSRHVVLVAIVANPLYRSVSYTRAFDRQELLTGVPNWLFLTGSLPQLHKAWRDYYVTAQLESAGGMVLHPDVAYVISPDGYEQAELNLDPGPGTASSKSSFAAELAQAAQKALRSP